VTKLPQQGAASDGRAERISRLDEWRGWIACATIVAAAVAYSFHFTSFLHAKEGVLCLGLCAMGLLVVLRGRLSRTSVTAFLPLWLWVGIELLRLLFGLAKVPSDAALESVRWLLLLLAVGFVLDVLQEDAWRRKMLAAVVLSTVAVAVLGLLQYLGAIPFLFPVFEGYTQRVYSVFGNQDFYGGYVALGLPLVLHRVLVGRRVDMAALAAACILTLGLLVSGSRSAWLAATAGVAVAIVVSERKAKRLALCGAVAAALTIATALAAPDATVRRITQTFQTEDEGRHARVFLWRAAWAVFGHGPVLGQGAAAYAYRSPQYLGDLVANAPDPIRFDVERHADQPHCEPLRVLAESGLVGLALWGWMAVRLLRRRGIEWAALAAFGVFACFNGPFDSVPHVLAALLLAAALLAREPRPAPPAHLPAYVLPALSVALCVFEVWAVLVPSYRLRAAQDAQLANRPALALYRRAAQHAWPHAEAHRDYAIALAEAGHVQSARYHFREALRGLDTGDLYLALAAVAIELDDLEEAHRWAEECLRRWPRNREATDLLAQTGDAP